MNAIRIFLPSAKSPPLVAGPSAITPPAFTSSPGETSGVWCKHIDWLDLSKLSILYLCSFPSGSSITIFCASTYTTLPSVLEITTAPESTATFLSNPVPIYGASVLNNGTACLCMFDPISALLASSCSRNGINPADTDTTCLGDISR